MCLFVVRAHLLQGLMYCTFRDALLYRLVVTRSYMSFCTFPISSKDTSHSLLTSGIKKLVLLKVLLFQIIFCYSCWKIRDQQFLKYSH